VSDRTMLNVNSTHWPPEPTWENVERLVGGALRWWDKWCPDDGRPAMAFEALKRHQNDPTLETDSALRRAARDLVPSINMAAAAMAEKPMFASPEVAAYYAAQAVRWAVVGKWPLPTKHNLNYWARAIDRAGMANLLGAMAYDDDDEDESPEASGE
jgi:glutathione S-transferase